MTDRDDAGQIIAWAAFGLVLFAIHSQIGGPWLRYTLLAILLWILLRNGPEVFALGSRLLSQMTDARPREWSPLAPRRTP